MFPRVGRLHAMTNRNPAVDAFMKALEHPRKADVERIRALLSA